MKKTIGFEISVRLLIEDFDELSRKEQQEALHLFQDRLTDFIMSQEGFDILDGKGRYIRGETGRLDGAVEIIKGELW